MLAALTYAGLAPQRDSQSPDLDPGFLTLVGSLVRYVRDLRWRRIDQEAAALIAERGHCLSDSTERLIGQRLL